MLIRQSRSDDAAAMTALLNRIIKIGGTTAHEDPKSTESVRDRYVLGPECITSVVAELDGQIVGWQSIVWWHQEAHIATFVDPDIQARGIGAALFAKTLDMCRKVGLAEIHASIRADNVSGLAFYARIGFQDVSLDRDFSLKDGRVVGRVNRIFRP